MNKTRKPILGTKFLALVGAMFCLSAFAQLAPLPPMNLGIVSLSQPQTASTVAVTSFDASGATRNNYTGTVGILFTCNSSIHVVALGRTNLSGNTGNHTLYLYDKTANSILASVTISTGAGTAGTVVYGNITSTALGTSHTYAVVSSETTSGDSWYDQATCGMTGVFVAANIYAYYDSTPPNGGGATGGQPPGSYVPVNFKYTTP